ncbi:MAG: hypothetical protein ACYSO4_00855 [Planctomycetota bacterium]
MKTRICLILTVLMFALTLSGCQRAAAKTEEQPAVIAEETTQPKSAKPTPRKTKPQQNRAKLSWTEPCSVEQAASAAKQTMEDLGLGGQATTKTRTVRTREPKTGKTVTKRVPVSTGSGSDSGRIYFKSDGLSAYVNAKSVTGIEYRINILLMPPESCRIAITATGPNPSDILKEHSTFIKQKISEAIQNPPAEAEEVTETLPYPETMVFDRTVSQVYNVIYNWSRQEKLDHSRGNSNDKYYRDARVNCASRIEFTFQMRLIDDNKTKLEIKASGYEGKDEFDLILKTLTESMEALKTDEPASKTAAYNETKTLNHPIAAVHGTLSAWVKENSFTFGRNSSGGDAFYKYFSCYTAAGMEFSFKMYLIDANKTKLEMTAGGQKDREEFPMILKSLEAALDGIGQAQPEPAAVSEKSCQGEQ